MGRTSPAQVAVVEAIARRQFSPSLKYPEMGYECLEPNRKPKMSRDRLLLCAQVKHTYNAQSRTWNTEQCCITLATSALVERRNHFQPLVTCTCRHLIIGSKLPVFANLQVTHILKFDGDQRRQRITRRHQVRETFIASLHGRTRQRLARDVDTSLQAPSVAEIRQRATHIL
ncbi:hypothetical protein GQ600_9762 [Phytophthora cactorum]|nr:hypothetical protein GQ600_9762 [Phytophthora cactorum]